MSVANEPCLHFHSLLMERLLLREATKVIELLLLLRFFVEDNRVQLDNTSSWILSIFWLAFRSFLSSTDANTSSHSDKCIKGKEEEEETKSYITTIVEMKLRFSSIFSLLSRKNVAKKNVVLRYSKNHSIVVSQPNWS